MITTTQKKKNVVANVTKAFPKRLSLTIRFPNKAVDGQINKAGIKFSSLETNGVLNKAFSFSRSREMSFLKKSAWILPSNFFTKNVFYKKFTTSFTIIIVWFFFKVSTIMSNTFLHSFIHSFYFVMIVFSTLSANRPLKNICMTFVTSSPDENYC